jgi:hypothetical protein
MLGRRPVDLLAHARSRRTGVPIAIVRVVQKRRFPFILAVILIAGYAYASTVGLILAAVGLAVIYLLSLRVHPRINHTGWRGCGGTGRHRGSVFTWTFRKCPGCDGGRLIRRGAGQWGAEHIRHEHARGKAARATAKSGGTWR